MYIFFFNDTATTEIYTLSLHDALPISSTSRPEPSTSRRPQEVRAPSPASPPTTSKPAASNPGTSRSEEHTSELQSRQYLVCRLLLEKNNRNSHIHLSLPHLT